MNYQDFNHWIRRVFPRLKVSWNVMFDQTSRSVDFLLQNLNLTLFVSWSRVPNGPDGHAFRVLCLPFSKLLRHGIVRWRL
jgi:hypothetical protein